MNIALEIAKQTILQSQAGMNTAINNISNSQVDGYSRQKVQFQTGVSINSNGHLVGTGAVIKSIDRIRDGFNDKQYRENVGIYSNASVMANSLKKIETFFGSIDGDTGVKSTLTELFNSLEELSKYPENSGIKQIVKDSGVAVAQSFNQVASNLKTMKSQYASFVESKVTDINAILKDLNTLNDEIGRITVKGQTPNDLLDARDRLLDELAKNIDISIVETDNNKINIISNGQILLQDGYVNQLDVAVTNGYDVTVTYANGADFKSTHGELSALISTVTDVIPKYQAEIDTMAKDFMDAFNAIHSVGFAIDGSTGIDFFEGNDASSIKVSADILNNPDKIATSTDGAAGNNDLVLELIGIKSNKVIDGKYGVLEFYDKISAGISAETKAMTTKEANYKYITNEVYVMRANEIGVNVDEEIIAASNYQKTFAAASRIIQTLDEMFNSLIQSI